MVKRREENKPRPLTLPVPVAGRIYFNLSRNGSYEAARRGDLPILRVGRLLKVSLPALERMIEQAGAPGLESVASGLPEPRPRLSKGKIPPTKPTKEATTASVLRVAGAPPRQIIRGNREANKAGPLPTGTGLQFCSPASRKNNQDDHT
jgi:hypothetical protein